MKKLLNNKLFKYYAGVLFCVIAVGITVIYTDGALFRGDLGPSITCSGLITGKGAMGTTEVTWSANVQNLPAHQVKWTGPNIDNKTGDKVKAYYTDDIISKVNVQASLAYDHYKLDGTYPDTGKVTYCDVKVPATMNKLQVNPKTKQNQNSLTDSYKLGTK